MKRDLLVIGNYGHDEIITARGERFSTFGGATPYMCAVLEALGADYEVVAKVGRDFLYDAEVIRKPLVDPALPTTGFLDDFTSGRREGTVKARCAPILPVDLPGTAKIAVANGCAGETPPQTVAHLRKISDVVVCDLQSLIRVVSSSGRIELVKFSQSGHDVRCIDFLKGSAEEAAFVDVKGPPLIVTDSNGCEIIDGSKRTRVEGFPAKEVDASGAGDSFLAGFAYALAKGDDVQKAARLANFCGALAVQQHGIPKLTRTHFAEVG